MKINEAADICIKFLERCDDQKERARKMCELSSRVRRGEISQEDAKRQHRRIQGAGNTVNCVGDLELAVRVILKSLKVTK